MAGNTSRIANDFGWIGKRASLLRLELGAEEEDKCRDARWMFVANETKEFGGRAVRGELDIDDLDV